MARIAVRRDAFEQGQFPAVCCKTGKPLHEHVGAFKRWEFSDTPSWTWILIFFGIFPFLIATAFATERFSGVLPISARADGRLVIARRFVWIFGLAAVASAAVGLSRFDAFIPISIAFALLCVGALILGWVWSPNANLDGRDVVVLSNVHRGFVAAIREIPPPPQASTAPSETV